MISTQRESLGINVQVIDSNTLSMETPVGSIGNENVTVTTGDGTSVPNPPYSTFTYQGDWLAYVTNSSDETVTVIDVATETSIMTIDLNLGPSINNFQDVAFTPNGKKAYVTNFNFFKV